MIKKLVEKDKGAIGIVGTFIQQAAGINLAEEEGMDDDKDRHDAPKPEPGTPAMQFKRARGH